MSDGRAEAGRKEEEESGEKNSKTAGKERRENEAKGGKDAARLK